MCTKRKSLGGGGIIPLKQLFLRALSLTTGHLCTMDDELDLSTLHHLQSLYWKAVHPKDVGALSPAIQVNKTHLRTLELDSVNWKRFGDCSGPISNEEGGDREASAITHSYFIKDVVGLRRRQPQPLLPQLGALSLTQVPLEAALAHAINFDSLRSLTLRMCPGWSEFVKTALELKVSLQPIALEIQETNEVSRTDSEYIIQDFLEKFEGLEKLFFSGFKHFIDIWHSVAHCHPTFKRFVQAWREDDEVADIDHGRDGLVVSEETEHIITESSLRENNPLAKLELECIGLCDRSWLVSFNVAGLLRTWQANQVMQNLSLLPYRYTKSLKLLHIRPSAWNLAFFL